MIVVIFFTSMSFDGSMIPIVAAADTTAGKEVVVRDNKKTEKSKN